MGFVWALSGIGAGIGMLVAIWTTVAATSAPQEAAGYAQAMAWAVLPYIMARSMEFDAKRVTRVEIVETKEKPEATKAAKPDASGVYEIE